MKSIRIRNLRSLVDTGTIELKPITVLLGENSAGKSTFLRTFPLLKQSVETPTTGPILWYGNLVDFGSFPDAINRQRRDGTITFEFVFPVSRRNNPRLGIRDDRFIDNGNDDIDTHVSIEIEHASKQELTRAKKIELEFLGHRVRIEFGKDNKIGRFLVNDTEIFDSPIEYDIFQQNLLPQIRIIPEYSKRVSSTSRNTPNSQLLLNEVKKIAHKNTGEPRIQMIIRHLRIGTSEEMLSIIQNLPKSVETASWNANTSYWEVNNQQFCRLRDIVIADGFWELYEAVAYTLLNTSRSINYIAPLRASAERYYRLQGLAVNEVDAQGQNLAVFIRNLSDRDSRRYEEWMNSSFGFVPTVGVDGGHISLRLRMSDSDQTFNLADMGFGFSQVLPVLTQLWMNQDGRTIRPFARRGSASIFAIEQPELHLHPRMQATLADVFAATVTTSRRENLTLIIETHSETIVNRLGHLIAADKLNADDVNIVLFEKEPSSLVTKVRTTSFDKEGYLIDWPYGFFQPDMP